MENKNWTKDEIELQHIIYVQYYGLPADHCDTNGDVQSVDFNTNEDQR